MTAVRDHTDTPVGRIAGWLDDRLGAAKFTRSKLNYVFPEHFSFLFGEIALYAFMVLVATGIFLSLFYSPSEAQVVYRGDYEPLVGVTVREAYETVVRLSFDVPVGLLMRQTHHWAALVFLGAIIVHLSRVFFTGAFRRPRELNWMTGVVLLIVGMLEGYVGYSLLDDLLSGQGLRIGYSVLQSVPVIGPAAAFWIFGGEYPGSGTLQRLFVVHIFLMPALIATLIAIHLALITRQHHTQFPGRGRTERNVVGLRMWPTYATKSVGLALIVAGVLTFMGGWFQINPVWLYGPYDAFLVTSAPQADWYVLWLEGALRLFPPIQLQAFGYTLANQFFPGVLIPGLAFTVLLFWPFLEARATGDRRAHHLLDRPRDRPIRTAIGAATLAAFVQLLLTGSDDVMAASFDWSIVALRWMGRVLIVVLPLAVGLLTWKTCRDLARRDPLPAAEPAPSPAPDAETAPLVGGDGRLGRASRWAVTASMGAALVAAVFGRARGRFGQ